jgi:hypothetical protein
MNLVNLADGFDFQDQRFINYNIQLIMPVERSIFLNRRQLPLASEGQACFSQFVTKRAFIHALHQSRLWGSGRQGLWGPEKR